MADSKIFKYANDVSFNRNSKSGRSITTGGYAKTHRLGTNIYTIEANLPVLSESQYKEVEAELFEINDGIDFLNVNISSNNGNNIMSRGTIPLKTGETNIKVVKQDYSKLNQFTIINLAPNTNDIFKVGDFIQFDNNTKVYQIYKPVGDTGTSFNTSPAGTVRVRLSSPVISNMGLSNNISYGAKYDYRLVTGQGDTSENVSYTWTSSSTSLGVVGKIIFKDANTGLQYNYADGTPAELWLKEGHDQLSEVRTIALQGINGTSTSHSSFTTYMINQNNKLGQILNYSFVIGSLGNFSLTFNVPNVRAELVTPNASAQTLTNETVNTQILNPYQEGLLSIKDVNNNPILDNDGNAVTVVLPKTLEDAVDIYNYLAGTIMGATSTHPLKTLGIWHSLSGANFPELYSETDINQTGKFAIRWGIEYDGAEVEFTTAVGTRDVAYNDYQPLTDVVTAHTNNPTTVTIENSTETYQVGEYLQPVNYFLSKTYTQKITNVNVSGTTTTLTFDSTYNSGSTGWTSYPVKILRHQDAITSSGNKVLDKIYESDDAQVNSSSANVLMGDDVNMQLMLSEKPQVTVIPLNETENLYQFNTFEFTEVL